MDPMQNSMTRQAKETRKMLKTKPLQRNPKRHHGTSKKDISIIRITKELQVSSSIEIEILMLIGDGNNLSKEIDMK